MITQHNFLQCFEYPPERPPIWLLKSQTGLPVNIVDVFSGLPKTQKLFGNIQTCLQTLFLFFTIIS